MTSLRDMRWHTRTGGEGTRHARLDGGGRLPVPFTAEFAHDKVELAITIDVANGVPVCTEYRVTRRGRGAGLESMTTEVMRNVKLRDLMALSCARVALEKRPGGGTSWATSVEAIEAVVGPIRRRRTPVTDENLEKIATAYEQRFVPGHMREFAEGLGYSERQMWRLVKLARERGFLPDPKAPSDESDEPVQLVAPVTPERIARWRERKEKREKEIAAMTEAERKGRS